MKIHLSAETVYLWGDWTRDEISHSNIYILTGLLDRIESGDKKRVRIDSTHLNKIDSGGEQFLGIWLECLNLRGIEYEIVNISEKQDISFKSLGFLSQSTSRNSFDRINPATNHSKRRHQNETRRNKGNCQAA